MPKKSLQRNRFSFYLLAIGSACGLGNLWRFPYVVGENGGGAFLLLYVFLSLTIGLSLLIAELMIGRYTDASILRASTKASEGEEAKCKKLFYFGWLSIVLSTLTLSYYSVISGWVLHYSTQFIMSIFQTNSADYLKNVSVNVLLQNGWLQFLLASVHLLVTVVIVVKRFSEGVEKRIATMLPVFGLLVVFLLIGSLSLDSKTNVLRFLFYPDFSKLSWGSLGHAIGHVLFTLSIGFGTMVTFGSYFKTEDHLPTIGLRVALVDTVISIIAVLLIFPIALMSTKQVATDPSLIFDVLPIYLSTMKGGIVFGLVFFLFLWLTALNASVGLLEMVTANITERRPEIKRPVAAAIAGFTILCVTVFPAFSGTVFKDVKLFKRSVIEFFDSTLVNVLLPVAAIGILFIFFSLFKEPEKRKLFIYQDTPISAVMYSHWLFILKWVVPLLIGAGLVFLFIGTVV